MSNGTTQVTLPAGCYGVEMGSTGESFNSKPGGYVDIPDPYMDEFKQSDAVRNGIIGTGRTYTLGTRVGMVCAARCTPRVNQAWTKECPACGGPTQPE